MEDRGEGQSWAGRQSRNERRSKVSRMGRKGRNEVHSPWPWHPNSAGHRTCSWYGVNPAVTSHPPPDVNHQGQAHSEALVLCLEPCPLPLSSSWTTWDLEDASPKGKTGQVSGQYWPRGATNPKQSRERKITPQNKSLRGRGGCPHRDSQVDPTDRDPIGSQQLPIQ